MYASWADLDPQTSPLETRCLTSSTSSTRISCKFLFASISGILEAKLMTETEKRHSSMCARHSITLRECCTVN